MLNESTLEDLHGFLLNAQTDSLAEDLHQGFNLGHFKGEELAFGKHDKRGLKAYDLLLYSTITSLFPNELVIPHGVINNGMPLLVESF